MDKTIKIMLVFTRFSLYYRQRDDIQIGTSFLPTKTVVKIHSDPISLAFLLYLRPGTVLQLWLFIICKRVNSAKHANASSIPKESGILNIIFTPSVDHVTLRRCLGGNVNCPQRWSECDPCPLNHLKTPNYILK